MAYSFPSYLFLTPPQVDGSDESGVPPVQKGEQLATIHQTDSHLRSR